MEQGGAAGGEDAMWDDVFREVIPEAPGHHNQLASGSGVRLYTLLTTLPFPWSHKQVGHPDKALAVEHAICFSSKVEPTTYSDGHTTEGCLGAMWWGMQVSPFKALTLYTTSLPERQGTHRVCAEHSDAPQRCPRLNL